MILADFGANVIRVDKSLEGNTDVLCRGKKSIVIDLKSDQGIQVIYRMISKVDILLEPYRPSIMEKLKLGPNELLERNPSLIYVRLTGFGQEGLYSKQAGHDLNYLAMSGVLSMLHRKNESPYFPMNLLGDFGGGSFYCVIGILLALIQRQKTGKGQVLDVSITHGTAYLSTFLWNMKSIQFPLNILCGDAPFYDVYKTKDNRYLTV
jgi:alpha-methylacyl-CoA racemase